MRKYFCSSIEDCVFGEDTKTCCYCGRSEPRRARIGKEEIEEMLPSERPDIDDEDEDDGPIISPHNLN